MTNAAHTPGFRQTTERCDAHRIVFVGAVGQGDSVPLDHCSPARLRWNRCSVRIVRARTRSGASSLERGFCAGPKPGSLSKTDSTGEHAQGWCHGSLPRNRFFVRFASPSHARQRACAGPPRTGGHVRCRVSRAVRSGSPVTHGAHRCGAPSAPRPRALRAASAGSGDIGRPSRNRPRPALFSGAGGPSSAHVRAWPACIARRESPFVPYRNRLGGFAP